MKPYSRLKHFLVLFLPSSTTSIRFRFLSCFVFQTFWIVMMQSVKVAKFGAYVYGDGTKYIGDWNDRGQKHGLGHVLLKDNSRYEGGFVNGLCWGLGVLQYPDGARYEGEFIEGWFHGYGMFWRADGMKYEGQFRGGRIWGLGLITFKDGTHGLPRHEGFFKDCKLVQRKKCPGIVTNAQRAALMARIQAEQT